MKYETADKLPELFKEILPRVKSISTLVGYEINVDGNYILDICGDGDNGLPYFVYIFKKKEWSIPDRLAHNIPNDNDLVFFIEDVITDISLFGTTLYEYCHINFEELYTPLEKVDDTE